jgi:heme A synthase
VALIASEAAIGAGLVLFRLVAENESVARALFMSAHLANTFVLLACLTLTAHFAQSDARPRTDAPGAWPFALAAVALLLVGVSGAIAALGDTLYPARSLWGALADDLSPTAHLLVRLRLAHPLLAFAGAIAVAFASTQALRGGQPGARRAARATLALVALQIAVGLANVALLAPVWMQLVHLLLADLLLIALVLSAVRALSPEGPGPAALALAA